MVSSSVQFIAASFAKSSLSMVMSQSNIFLITKKKIKQVLCPKYGWIRSLLLRGRVFSWQFTGNFTSDSMYETFATYLAHKILEIPPAVTARFEVWTMHINYIDNICSHGLSLFNLACDKYFCKDVLLHLYEARWHRWLRILLDSVLSAFLLTVWKRTYIQ